MARYWLTAAAMLWLAAISKSEVAPAGAFGSRSENWRARVRWLPTADRAMATKTAAGAAAGASRSITERMFSTARSRQRQPRAHFQEARGRFTPRPPARVSISPGGQQRPGGAGHRINDTGSIRADDYQRRQRGAGVRAPHAWARCISRRTAHARNWGSTNLSIVVFSNAVIDLGGKIPRWTAKPINTRRQPRLGEQPAGDAADHAARRDAGGG